MKQLNDRVIDELWDRFHDSDNESEYMFKHHFKAAIKYIMKTRRTDEDS